MFTCSVCSLVDKDSFGQDTRQRRVERLYLIRGSKAVGLLKDTRYLLTSSQHGCPAYRSFELASLKFLRAAALKRAAGPKAARRTNSFAIGGSSLERATEFDRIVLRASTSYSTVSESSYRNNFLETVA